MNKQLRDGYTQSEAGTPYQNTEDAGKVSGVLPQLLNFVKEEEVSKYLDDDEWLMEEKKDGVRQMIRKNKKVVEGINKKGLITSLPVTTEEAVRKACGVLDAQLDGELVGEVYWLFDLLSMGVHSYGTVSVNARLNAINEWFEESSYNDYFKLVPIATGKQAKHKLYNKLKKDRAEGVVFKKLDSPYKAGRPASGGTQVKFKFKGSATVRCKEINDKNSFIMEMQENGNWIEVGNCTFFPTKTVPEVSKFYEVEYLYAYPGGSLFQPTLKEARTDSDESDCNLSQLKYKQGTEEN